MDLKETKAKAKLWINANVHDGEDRTGCNSDYSRFTPDELYELIEDLLDDLLKPLDISL